MSIVKIQGVKRLENAINNEVDTKLCHLGKISVK